MNSLSATTSSDIQMDYMKLLVTQLQNQDPLEPLNNNEMASQLSQLSQLNQLETMNQSFETMLATIQRNYADSLLGKEVSFNASTETGTIDIYKGTVEQIYHNINGDICLLAGDSIIKLEDVISVKN